MDKDTLRKGRLSVSEDAMKQDGFSFAAPNREVFGNYTCRTFKKGPAQVQCPICGVEICGDCLDRRHGPGKCERL